tara:strand:- start:2850 stop:3638 length:789 start_codon:yes stop_codon:yes gene_type:complete
MFSTFTTVAPFAAAEPGKKRKREKKAKKDSKDTPDIAETIRKLEGSRTNERIRFARCIKAAEKLYHKVFKFMLKFKEMLRKHADDQSTLAQIKKKARERLDELLARLHELEALTWREQTRGPTSSRSWSIGDVDDPSDHPALWILWTKPPEHTIRDDEDAPTLNYEMGSFLTWGLPKNKMSKITLNVEVFTKGKPVYVIEKYHERDSEGKLRVQHRIKGLYFIFKNIAACSTKAAMVTWEDLVNGWFTGIKKEKEAPRWTKN